MKSLSLRVMLAILGGVAPSLALAHENETQDTAEIKPECGVAIPQELASEPSTIDQDETDIETIIAAAKIKVEKCLITRVECI